VINGRRTLWKKSPISTFCYQHPATQFNDWPSFANSADPVYFWFDELSCQIIQLKAKEMSDYLVLK